MINLEQKLISIMVGCASAYTTLRFSMVPMMAVGCAELARRILHSRKQCTVIL